MYKMAVECSKVHSLTTTAKVNIRYLIAFKIVAKIIFQQQQKIEVNAIFKVQNYTWYRLRT